MQLAILVAAGAAVALITRLAGETGDVELLVDNIHVLGGAEDARRLRSLHPGVAALRRVGRGHGPRGAAGAEHGHARHLGRHPAGPRRGPTCASSPSPAWPPGSPCCSARRSGSALFALEILHRRGLQYYEALLPAVVGSLCGYGVYLALSGAGIEPVWTFARVGTLHGGDLAIAAGVGVVGAVGAAVFTAAGRRPPGGCSAGPPIGALRRSAASLLGLLGLWSPYALTFGEDQLGGLLDVRLAAGALAVAVAGQAGSAPP